MLATTGMRAMAEPKPATPPPRAPPRSGDAPDAFDIWLRASMRRVHDAVAAEPVPEALRRLAAGGEPSPAEVMQGATRSGPSGRTAARDAIA